MLVLIAALAVQETAINYVISQNGQAIGQEHARIAEDGKKYEVTTVIGSEQMQYQTETDYDLRGPTHYQIAGKLSGHDIKIVVDRKGSGFHATWTVNNSTQEKDVPGDELLENDTVAQYGHFGRIGYGNKLKHFLVYVPQSFGTVDVNVTDDGETHVIELYHQPMEVHFVKVQYIGGPMVELSVAQDRNVYRVVVPAQNFVIVADANAVNAYAKDHLVKFPHDPDEIELAGAREKTVSIQSNGLTIYGTLTTPKDARKPPLAILFQGAGPESRNARIGVHSVLADLAGVLAKMGVASLRFDKRFYTYRNIPVGVDPQATFETDMLDDPKAIVQGLKQAPPQDLDAGRLLLVGFDVGTVSALSQAAGASALILIAPPMTPPDEAMLREQAHILKTRDHADQDMIDKTLAPLKAALKQIRGGQDAAGVSLSALYLKTALENSAARFAEHVTKPVLVVAGKNDFQMQPAEAQALTGMLKAAGSDVTYVELPKMNHTLRDVSVSDGRDYEDTAPLSPAFRKAFTDFVQKRIVQPR